MPRMWVAKGFLFSIINRLEQARGGHIFNRTPLSHCIFDTIFFEQQVFKIIELAYAVNGVWHERVIYLYVTTKRNI